MQLRNLDNTEFVEIDLTTGDQAVNKAICDVAPQLPKECILVSIRRDGKMMIPHGDTMLQVGDRITAFVAVRDNDLAAQVMGVNLFYYKLLAFFISCFYSLLLSLFFFNLSLKLPTSCM